MTRPTNKLATPCRSLTWWMFTTTAVLLGESSVFGFVQPVSLKKVLQPSNTDAGIVSAVGRLAESSVLEETKKKEVLRQKLPPLDPATKSKLEIEFRELLESVLYTPDEINAVANPRLRAIFEGVAASYCEPAVYRAFEVLFEDYMPLRVAGRVIHKKMKKVMENSKEYRTAQFESVLQSTDLSSDVIGSSWISFVETVGERHLTLDDVENAKKMLKAQHKNLELSSSSSSTATATVNDKKWTFADLMQEIHSMGVGSNVDPDILLEDLWDLGWEVARITKKDAKRAKHDDRYDYMVSKFGEWKEFVPDGEGRRLDIMRGCFVGAENEKVVEALRVVYTDNQALRLSGDWIFKVVSALVNTATSRRKGSGR